LKRIRFIGEEDYSSPFAR